MRRAFTLIELLVVIAIIAILAAILFPVFAQAREKARQATCQSNEKQMALGVIMYANDYDEAYPPGEIMSPASNGFMASWKTVTYPYTKSLSIYACPNSHASLSQIYNPSDPSAIYWSYKDQNWLHCFPNTIGATPIYTNDPMCVTYNPSQLWFDRGYVLNGAAFGVQFRIGQGVWQGPLGISGWSVQTMAAVTQAAETSLIEDTKNYEAISLPRSICRCQAGNPMGAPTTQYADASVPGGLLRHVGWWVPHNRGMNFAFADGHVKYYRIGAVYGNNIKKYDCQRTANDETTWPGNSFPEKYNGCWDAQTSTPQYCASLAALLSDGEVR